jgi:hypothetical protein|tara:strand:+ start:850 stop:1836 length:987 start_codon:yes stop_codon:yes gene_type:complete
MAGFGPTNTYETYDVEGMREDLGPVIFNIDPTDAPVMSAIARGTANQITHEWQTDTLDAAAFNRVDEGNVSAFDAVVKTERPKNYLQISEKTLSLSGTLQSVVLAGRSNELGYQLARLAKSLKRDCEFTISRNQAADAGSGDGATQRALASYECWIRSAGSPGGNANRDATTGADATFVAGSPTTAPTDSSATRALQESHLQSVLQSCWQQGGDVNLIVAGPYNKRQISGFAGNSTRFDIGEDQRLTASISVYISDYGEHRIVASRFSRDQTVLCMDTMYWSMNFLRPFREIPLAKSGDSDQHMMNVEYTLCAYNSRSSGAVCDLTTA